MGLSNRRTEGVGSCLVPRVGLTHVGHFDRLQRLRLAPCPGQVGGQDAGRTLADSGSLSKKLRGALSRLASVVTLCFSLIAREQFCKWHTRHFLDEAGAQSNALAAPAIRPINKFLWASLVVGFCRARKRGLPSGLGSARSLALTLTHL